jgi:hypothetical protein
MVLVVLPAFSFSILGKGDRLLFISEEFRAVKKHRRHIWNLEK